MADQLVSADPSWTGAQADPTVPRMSAAPEDRPVTLGDLEDDPKAAIQRIGTILKKDASDPKLWFGLAASYFAPKMLNVAMPIVSRAASAAGRLQVDPSVAMREFSINKPQNALKAVSLKEQPVADRVPGFDRYMPNASADLTTVRPGASMPELQAQVQKAVANGINPSQAVAQISGGNPQTFGQLMTAYMQSRQVR